MTDKGRKRFFSDAFTQWAFLMIRSGKCLLKNCIEYDNDKPSIKSEKCVACYHESTNGGR